MTTQGALARVLALSAFSTGLVLTGCGGGSSDNTGGEQAEVTATATITGLATDARTGSPLANARIRVGNDSATTNTEGRYSLVSRTLGARVVVEASASGYARNFETVALSADATPTLDLQLLPADATGTVSAATAQVVRDDTTPAQVSLPANAYVTSDGSAYTGQVTVQMAVIDPASNLDAMPGELLTRGTDGAAAPIESFGALAVDLSAADGSRLNLAAGSQATVRIPVRTRTPAAALPATIPLFYFDETQGLWIAEGSASLAADRSYYEGSVSHFSVWNADRVLETIRYRGCVVTLDQRPAVGVAITSDGINYSGRASVVSGSDGCFTVPMRLSGTAVISGASGTLLTNAVSAGPSAVDLDQSSTPLVLGSVQASFSIRLTWGEQPLDVDSHLFLPDGQHVYFGNEGGLGASPFAALDVDDVTSFGPEVITVRRVMKGRYIYALRNFSGEFDPGMTDSPVRVELSIGGQTRALAPTAGVETSADNWWQAFEINVDDNCALSWRVLDTWSLPTPAPGVAQWCE